jgi:Zn-dependent metalloprotease
VTLAAAALAAALPAFAVQAGPAAARDKARFGFDHPFAKMRKGHAKGASQAFTKFNLSQGRVWKMRFSPRTGNPTSLLGGSDTPRYGTTRQIGSSFIDAHPDMLGLDPTTLTYERSSQGAGHSTVLFRQSYKGLPVEFAAVKVHVAADGSVLGAHSSYEPNITVPTTPTVTAAAAAATALADAGNGKAAGTPALVILPSETDGLAHLAWKMTVRAPAASWRYYVDALSGVVLLRYNTHEFAGFTGTVTGQVYQLDPQTTPHTIAGTFDNQYVYLGASTPYIPGLTRLTTNASGQYTSTLNYPVSMSLQGPYVSVAEFRGTSAHYDNGPGLWTQCTTAATVPNPYVFGDVYTSTLNTNSCGASNIASMIPEFTAFQVGHFDDNTTVGGEGGALTQDDQVTAYDPTGAAIGSYVGCIGCIAGAYGGVFYNSNHGPEAHGSSYSLTLSAKGGSNVGYTVATSSALYFTNPTAVGALSPSHVWTSSDTFIPGSVSYTPGCLPGASSPCPNLHGEISLFYHLNQMHDFFTYGSLGNGGGGQFALSGNPGPQYSPGVNSCTPGPSCPGGAYAPLPGPVAAMVHVGPDLLNAFYDPDFDDLFFGDGLGAYPSDAFVDDATVPHHEYTHYIVNKIWPLVNFGQAGTISEANADYFSASSLNDPNIGSWIESSFGNAGYTPLRQLTCTGPATGPAQPPTCFTLGQTAWTGEIHSDSPFVSQALWQIRENMGQQCGDNLEFQALLFYPESFEELYDALYTVAGLGASGCSSTGLAQSAVASAFGAHIPQAITPAGVDAYEPNDGFDTATDISTIPVLSATIYPVGDQDFYSFGAGPGPVTATLKLPLTTYAPGTYSAYQMFLYDSGHNQVATVAPPFNGFGSNNNQCNDSNGSTTNGCTTTTSQISMSYNNPTGQLMFVEVVGGTYINSPSDVNSQVPYTLNVSFPQNGALASSIVTASYGADSISFQVNVTTYTTSQLYRLAYVELVDQGGNPMTNANTSQAGSVIALTAQTNANGQINGTLQLQPGFFSAYPAAGTLSVEVFAYDVLGSTRSLGISNPINLTGTGSGSVTAYNNVFNPLKGQQAIVKYATTGAGRMILTIYTVLGERVTTLLDSSVPAGLGSANWNGRNSAGNVVASGIYIVRAQGPGVDDTVKIAVIK